MEHQLFDKNFKPWTRVQAFRSGLATVQVKQIEFGLQLWRNSGYILHKSFAHLLFYQEGILLGMNICFPTTTYFKA